MTHKGLTLTGYDSIADFYINDDYMEISLECDDGSVTLSFNADEIKQVKEFFNGE